MFQTNSLIFKNAIVYVILFFVGIGLISILLLRDSAKEIIQGSKLQFRHYGELIQLKCKEQLSSIQEDLQFMAESPALRDYLHTKSTNNLDKLNNTSLAILRARSYYSQVRFIGIDPLGQEISRVERNNKGTYIVSEDSLQLKRDRPYFKNALQLKRDSIYVSEIDLNREYGKIVDPHVPTWRVATPIYVEDVLRGVLVINADLSDLFTALTRLVEGNSKLRLVNAQGYHLLHENHEKEFQFEFGRDNEWKSFYPFELEELRLFEQHTFNGMNDIFTTQRIHLDGVDQKLYSIIKTDRSDLLTSYYQWRNKNFTLVALLTAGFFGIAALLINTQVRKMKQLTREIQEYASSDKLEVQRGKGKDELVELTSAFSQMREQIDYQMDELKQAKLTADQAVSDKTAFIENMSHEIRNPLQSILGITEILAQNTENRRQQDLVKSLKFNTQNLHGLVNDILDYRQIVDHKITLFPTWINLKVFTEDLTRSHMFTAVQKGVSLTVECDRELSTIEVFLDKIRLSQVMHNLLSNAIKFTPKDGSVKVLLSISEGEILDVLIQDTGKGIEEHEISYITERYAQSDNKNALDGYGIGLHIVVLLLELMQSQLKISSQIGKGSTFSFQLPCSSRELQSPRNSKESHKNDYRIAHASMLVIEDDVQIASIYEHHLKSKVYSYQHIASINEIASIDRDSIHIVISDYRVGDKIITDYQAQIEAVLHHESLSYLASANDSGAMAKLEVFDRVLQKPFEGANLSSMIYQDWMDKHGDGISFDSIINDYDAVESLYIKAINILSQEWKKARDIIKKAITTSNYEEFDSIRHKIITTIRRLKLNNLENKMQQIQPDDFNTENTIILANEIDLYLSFYDAKIDEFLSKYETSADRK